MRPFRTSLLLLGWLIVALAWLAPAHAEPPLDVEGQVTDHNGTLSSSERQRVQQALDDLFDRTGIQLFVVYVDDFDGLDGIDWADETAIESGIGEQDLLLAIATRERSFGISVDDGSALSDRDIERVERQLVLPELRGSDWAGAAVAAAEGFTDAASTTDVPWGWILAGGGLAAGGGAYAVHRVRRRRDERPALDENGQPVDPTTRMTTDELDAKASRDLVAVDDAVKTSEQELGFAEAQFPVEDTAVFRTTLDEAKAKLREAFTIRQRLDDSDPEPDDERRAMSISIIETCAEVDAALDAQVESFNRLRDLVTRAPEVLAALPAQVTAARERVPAARETVARLTAEHGETAVSPVAANPDQADALLQAADEAIAAGLAAVQTTDATAAARHTHAAEHAIAQTGTLLEAITRAETDLAEIARQRDQLRADLARVTAQVKAVGDYIETRRGAVGAQARTRLAEAARQLDTAQRSLDTDTPAATAALQRAESLANDAQRSAQNDVDRYHRESQRTTSGHGGGGILGNVSSGWGGSSSSGWSSSSSRSSSSRRSSSSSSSRRSSSSSRSSSRSSSSRSGGRSRGGRF